MSTRSLRFRLIAWYAGLLTAVFLLLAALMFVGLKHYLEASLAEAQERRAQQIADTLLANVSQTGEAAVGQGNRIHCMPRRSTTASSAYRVRTEASSMLRILPRTRVSTRLDCRPSLPRRRRNPCGNRNLPTTRPCSSRR